MGLPFRLLALLLAVLPAVWMDCPCCRQGCEIGGTATRVASRPVKRCPCCEKKRAEKDRRAPRNPADCDGCGGAFLRSAVAPAPTTVALPAPDLTAVMACLALPALAETEVVTAPAHGPEPPDPMLVRLRSVVLLI